MKRFKEDLLMILVDLEVDLEKNEDGKIVAVKEVVGMNVNPEPKRKPTVSSQCYRCQLYRHVQYKSTAQYKWMRCAESPRLAASATDANCIGTCNISPRLSTSG
ncbi:hypothetical protein QE152_g29124 [Popillia japonica]|uniref:Uncharacterized protein n=1 Tax=Popillia japonica TaxID=7064 RepID=A0AAW1JKI8_POPJA